VTEKAKKEMKENMLRQMGSLQEGKKAGEDDYLVCDMTNGTVSVEGTYVSVRNVAEEGRALFKGKKAGDKFDVDVNLAFANETDRAAMLKIKKDQLKDLDPLFHVTVVNVKTFVSAEANQETFDKLFGPDKVHNDEEFTAAVEERLVENYKQEADYRFGKDLKKYLVEKAAVTLPEDFLKRWLVYINEGKFTAEQIEAEFPSFIEDFKWQTVRSSLMEKYGLKVEQKDLQEAAEAFAAYQYAMYGMGGVPQEMIREAAQRVLADERQSRQIEENVEDQKVITAVREVVTLANKKITVEKFRELK
jgi:trigger factor